MIQCRIVELLPWCDGDLNAGRGRPLLVETWTRARLTRAVVLVGGGPARDLDAILDPGKQTKKLLQLLWTHFSVITGYPGGPSLLGSVHEGVRDVLSWLAPVFCVLLCGNRTTEYQRTLLSRWWGGGRGAELLCDRARSVLKIT